jgi:hypothetical protein
VLADLLAPPGMKTNRCRAARRETMDARRACQLAAAELQGDAKRGELFPPPCAAGAIGPGPTGRRSGLISPSSPRSAAAFCLDSRPAAAVAEQYRNSGSSADGRTLTESLPRDYRSETPDQRRPVAAE